MTLRSPVGGLLHPCRLRFPQASSSLPHYFKHFPAERVTGGTVQFHSVSVTVVAGDVVHSITHPLNKSPEDKSSLDLVLGG